MNNFKIFRHPLSKIGAALFLLADPLLYLVLGSLVIDFRNILGANIDPRSISFDTHDPFIQTMYLVSFIGVLLFFLGVFLFKKQPAHSDGRSRA
jgi:hypothetical protein